MKKIILAEGSLFGKFAFKSELLGGLRINGLDLRVMKSDSDSEGGEIVLILPDEISFPDKKKEEEFIQEFRWACIAHLQGALLFFQEKKLSVSSGELIPF
ncbi:MAG: hypothetical protein K8T10_20010 [Candidatus Eremiobacteraeota bacterium]|nr:hypothetical protein [Candidatus Eremiobacteraeota bacterium]